LTATAVSSSQINLSWTASTDAVGVTGYRIERCQGASCTNFAQIGTSSGTTFNDMGLSASTTYRYQVRATDAAGNLSGYSNIASATTPQAADTQPPTVASVSPGSGATDVATSTNVSAQFSESIDPASVTSSSFELRDAGGALVAATITTSGQTATLDPTPTLTAGAAYTATVKGGSSGVKDLAGNALATDFSWSFTTLEEGTVTTFGTTVPGSDVDAATANLKEVSLYTAPVAGSVVKLTGYVSGLGATSGSQPVRAVLYANANGAPGALLGVSNQITMLAGQPWGWVDFTFPSPVAIGAGPVWMGYIAGTRSDLTLLRFDPSPGGVKYNHNSGGYAAGPSNPFGSASTANFHYSLYATLQTGSGGPATCPCSIWSSATTPQVAAATDSTAYELGVKFRSDTNGYVTGLRFYKGTGNTGTHVGHLWTAGGQLLATATFTNETATGWQQVNFASPIAISANTTYIASYFAPNGHYALDRPGFVTSVDNPPLHALADGTDGPNGVFKTGSSGFPDETYGQSNYWVDVVFDTIAPSAFRATTAASSSQINLSWTASTDTVGVTGYRIERCQGASCTNFVQVRTPLSATAALDGPDGRRPVPVDDELTRTEARGPPPTQPRGTEPSVSRWRHDKID
jgi:hypothetical protein